MMFFSNTTLFDRVAVYSDFSIPGCYAASLSQQGRILLFTRANMFVYDSLGLNESTGSVPNHIVIHEKIEFYNNLSVLLGSIAHNVLDNDPLPNGTDLIGSALFKDANFMISRPNLNNPSEQLWYYNSSMSSFCDYPLVCGEYGLCNRATRECSCPVGFKMAVEKPACKALDEATRKCSCPEEFQMPNFKSTCIASDPAYSLQPINVSFHPQPSAISVSSQDECVALCAQNASSMLPYLIRAARLVPSSQFSTPLPFLPKALKLVRTVKGKAADLNTYAVPSPDLPALVLDWEKRCRIALDTAKGLEYLHHQSSEHIVHCDVKPANILLDEDFHAKVADFGLAKLMESGIKSFTMTTLKGTRGYLAPEWLQEATITAKSDVYSYGVVLLELLTGHRCLDPVRGYLPVWAMKIVAATQNNAAFKSSLDASKEDSFVISSNDASFLQSAIMDERLYACDVPADSFVHILILALACVQTDPVDRPSMASVVQILEGMTQALVLLAASPSNHRGVSECCIRILESERSCHFFHGEDIVVTFQRI
ncbi:hypothetical protein L7F22_045388 [Adiantum nelumboides]|nr:hypothetical protein [Adiantum nelumboides]